MDVAEDCCTASGGVLGPRWALWGDLWVYQACGARSAGRPRRLGVGCGTGPADAQRVLERNVLSGVKVSCCSQTDLRGYQACGGEIGWASWHGLGSAAALGRPIAIQILERSALGSARIGHCLVKSGRHRAGGTAARDSEVCDGVVSVMAQRAPANSYR